ncbi:polysaccharide biosynthesis protein [Candidatus Nitrosopumilus sp. SW]|uniref:SDR family NAD(P)-dependent oxidoreductase n=1 Tax=Candidatus Nitrosopumilus sp. SW TaxID=2508726 RepID=UPI00114DD249|nr:SDR family NAD(P)-dependent oxidoreductase [Candidatus Nitrosopumilus sp. SW]QDI88806.1 polysaccharide biosynthesis protein [Candidatus Nitrosopumilus sp. SW]
MQSILNKKNILVTGGTGSIGQALVKRSISDGAKHIKVFSNDENALYEMELEFEKFKNIEYIIGDIRDSEKINNIVKNCDIIFHAAALKHVDRCELHPLETITVNILGTNNVAKAAIHENVKNVICISTDKAVNPIGVMGATKLLSEKLFSAESFHSQSKTIFASVRFGNVFHTRGSILPRIEKQIQKGGPLTLTDEHMNRYFMTKEDAVNLIINATKIARGGETFVLKMPLLRLNDLFDAMKEIVGPKYGFKPNQIKTKKIGIRPGEKLTEYLLTDFEMNHALETKNFFIIPKMFESIDPKKYVGSKKPKNISTYFKNQKPISKQEIIKFLKTVY